MSVGNGSAKSKNSEHHPSFNSGDGVMGIHCFSWILHNGPIPEINGKKSWVCHKCDNVKCVNPKHLFLGDAIINAHDMIAKGRKSEIVPFGEGHHRHKLSEQQVRVILRAVRIGAKKAPLARMFKISRRQIRQIADRQYWKHITL